MKPLQSVEDSPAIAEANSIFEQPWWLEAVSPGAWGEAKVEENGAVAGRLPYAIKRKYGLTIVGNPPLTQTLGPWLRPSTKAANELNDQKKLTEDLLAQL